MAALRNQDYGVVDFQNKKMKRGNTEVYLGNVEFDNKDRKRYYGLRKGDTVEEKGFGKSKKGEVIGYGFLDNNQVMIKMENGKITDAVAEYCEIITKVEDKQNG